MHIAFEFADTGFVGHPDVRTESSVLPNTNQAIITVARVVGCRVCQNTASKCICPNGATVVERPLWDRATGVVSQLSERLTKKATKPAPTPKQITVHDLIIRGVQARLGSSTFRVLNGFEKDMLSFEKFRIEQLPPEDIARIISDLSALESVSNEPKNQIYKRVFGVSYALSEAVKRIYFTYPESVFADIAMLHKQYGLPLLVRPLDQSGGLKEPRRGVSAKMTIVVPDDINVTNHIVQLLPDENIGRGMTVEVDNTKVAMSLLMLHNHRQEESFGPAWEPDQKLALYKKYNLAHLLNDE